MELMWWCLAVGFMAGTVQLFVGTKVLLNDLGLMLAVCTACVVGLIPFQVVVMIAVGWSTPPVVWGLLVRNERARNDPRTYPPADLRMPDEHPPFYRSGVVLPMGRADPEGQLRQSMVNMVHALPSEHLRCALDGLADIVEAIPGVCRCPACADFRRHPEASKSPAPCANPPHVGNTS